VRKECENCGEELNVNPVDRPNLDWVKVVCSNCATVNQVSMIRFSQEVRSQ
jgi:uncharacterized Zn finger protein